MTLAPPATPRRRKQLDRSAATQEKVVHAAAALLQTNGYAATTVQAIARQGGISLGAMQHHFPTKALVMAAVLRHYGLKRASLYRRAMTHKTTPTEKIDAMLEALWTLICEGPEFIATIEIELARRSDAELAEATAPVLARIDAFMARWLANLTSNVPPTVWEPLRLLATTMLRGLALEIVRGTPLSELEKTYAIWCSFARAEYFKIISAYQKP